MKLILSRLGMNPGEFGLENLLKPRSSSSQFLAAPLGPHGLAEMFWAPALSILYFCLGKVEADTPVFSYSFLSLSRCQHLKVNNIQEGSGVRAASGLSLSPQAEAVRVWIWLVSSAERSWTTPAPGLDTVSSAGAVAVREKGGCLLNSGLSVSMQTLCSRPHVVQAPSSQRPTAALRELNSRPNEPIIPHTTK